MRVGSILLLMCVVAACGSGTIGDTDGNAPVRDAAVADVPLNLADAPPGGNPDSGSGNTPDARFQVNDAGQPLCDSGSGPVVCQCADGVNNDSDSFIDAADPECTGPFDNDESSFATGIPGDNQSRFVMDCFFDGDSGSGNDGCRWDIRCAGSNPTN